jgi:alkanesulfonate monooxygenase SsuD/methylene tetrahydromethanopterin reductase-like flavin-dependent oxidoreductase (luciferase family)
VLVGVGLPTRSRDGADAAFLEWARRADAGPFSSVAVTDRVVHDIVEPLVALAAASAVTRRVKLMTSIVLAPTRETTLLARQAASLDAMSGGRLVLGVGVGVRESDYTATGQRFDRRGRRLDAQLPELRRLWSHDGNDRIGPRAHRAAGPELLIGGYVSAVARRIASWGDGFMAPGGGDPASMKRLWSEIQREWRDAGRAGRPRWVGATYFALGPDADAAADAYIAESYGFDRALAERRRRSLPTTPDAVRDAIARQAEMGVDELVLRPCTPDLEHLDHVEALVAGLR